MERNITRRDFLNGVGVTITGSLFSASPVRVFGLEGDPPYYPPALTGLRGSHDGSWEVAHEMREGKSWGGLGPEAETGEVYDLVVVGGGISGLSAAYFFRKQAGPDARILVLDNHDDFGGHAK
jgi:spermidine dehydrogenase